MPGPWGASPDGSNSCPEISHVYVRSRAPSRALHATSPPYGSAIGARFPFPAQNARRLTTAEELVAHTSGPAGDSFEGCEALAVADSAVAFTYDPVTLMCATYGAPCTLANLDTIPEDAGTGFTYFPGSANGL